MNQNTCTNMNSSILEMKLSMNLDDHLKFQEEFIEKKIFDNPAIMNTESDKNSANNNKIDNIQDVKTKLPQSNNSENFNIKKLKQCVIKAINKKKEDLNQITVKIPDEEIYEETKITLTRKEVDFSKLGPLITNNIKMFISKIRKWGYLNNVSFLKQNDLKIINDISHYDSDNYQKSSFYEHLFCVFLTKIYLMSQKIVIFHPYNTFKLFWDFINAIIIIFLLFYIPFKICFRTELYDKTTNDVYICIIIIDMLIQMNTLYFEYGLEVRSRKLIIINYLKTGFIGDFISLIGIAVNSSITSNFNLISGNFLQILYFAKIITLFSINQKFLNRFQLSRRFKGIKDLLYLFFIIILVTHIVSCVWAFVASSQIPDNDFRNTWVKERKIENDEWFIIYLNSYYWSIITVMTVGYGDITPQNNLEILIALVSILFGCMVYAYSINTIGLIIQDINKDATKFNNTLDSINSYMIRKNIKAELQTRIREYLKFIWRDQKSLNTEEEEKIINSLSNTLREELLLESYGFFLKNNPLFTQSFSEISLRKLVTKMKEVFFTPEDVIYFQNNMEEDPNIYFIGKGTVKLYSDQNKSSVLLKELKEGEYFGERSFFTSLRRENSAVSDHFVTLFSLKQSDFLTIIQQNREDYETFVSIKEKILFYNDYSTINKKCFSCNQFNHIIEECPKLHYIPNIEKIIKKYNFPTENVERVIFTRKRPKKSNSLRNYQKNLGALKSKKLLNRLKTSYNQDESMIDLDENSDKEENSDQEKTLTKQLSELPNELTTETPKIIEKLKLEKTNSLQLQVKSDRLYEKANSFIFKTDLLDEENNNTPRNTYGSGGHPLSDSKLKKNAFEHQISKNSNINQIINSIPKEDSTPNILFDNNSKGKDKNPEIDEIYLNFDKVQSFKNYFPEFNIENIKKKQKEIKILMKEIQKKEKEGLLEIYKYFKLYSFYEKPLLESFVKEEKQKKIKTSSKFKKRRSVVAASHHYKEVYTVSTRKKDSYFKKDNDTKGKQIKTFGELISNIVAKNREEKK